MAAADPAGLDAAPAHRHHLGAEQGHHPLHRAHEGLVSPAPPHRLRPGDAGQEAEQQVGQQGAGVAAGDEALGHHVLALLAGDLAQGQRGRIDAVLLREADRGLGRGAIAEGGAGRRADHALAQVGLARRQGRHQERQPARRADDADVAVGQAGRGQRRGHLGRQLGQRTRQHAGRHLLGADLEQQVLGVSHGYASSCAAPGPRWLARTTRAAARAAALTPLSMAPSKAALAAAPTSVGSSGKPSPARAAT